MSKSPQQIIQHLSKGLDLDQDYVFKLIEKRGLLLAAKSLGYNTDNYDNMCLAGRIAIYLTKEKLGTSLVYFIDRMQTILDAGVLQFYKDNLGLLQAIIDKRELCGDLEYDWFSANTLLRTYLTKINYDSDEVMETPFQMYLRIAVDKYHNYPGSLDEKFELIDSDFSDLSNQLYIPASPIIFNSGLRQGQKASCFLLSPGDSLYSIHQDMLYPTAVISKNNGASGVDVSRYRHSRIANKGNSKGLVPWLKEQNDNIRAVDQGGKRKGACTVYCRPHHIDIYEFCEMPLKEGDPNMRGHDLNYAIWFPWLFWERVKNNENWTLMCPNESKKLNDIWGLEWEREYIECEKQTHNPDKTKMNRRTVKARDLLDHITKIQLQTGMPYILHGDTVNFKSNQKNLGYIRCSNLCLEICEFSSEDEIASCNLSSISLKAFVIPEAQTPGYSKITLTTLPKYYDFKELGALTRRIVERLNRIIDNNYYPLDQIKKSNLKHRPLGIGVSGFAEILYKLKLPLVEGTGGLNPIVKKLNKMIFACIYFNGLVESLRLAIKDGPYESFPGSPLSEGKLQFDLWHDEFTLLKSLGRIDPKIRSEEDDIPIDPAEWDQPELKVEAHITGLTISGLMTLTFPPTWNELRQLIKNYGVRNSLLLAMMPTATSAQPLRNTETCELPQSNLYSRKILNGAYPVLNEYLVKDLKRIGLWNKYTYNLLQADNGSISKLRNYVENNLSPINRVPEFNGDFEAVDNIINLYITMWELSNKIHLKLAADRGRYIDQSQSTNVYMSDPTKEKMMALHQYGNRLGLKTGMYYLRVDTGIDPIKITVDSDLIKFVGGRGPSGPVCSNGPSGGKKQQIECTDEVCIVCQ